MTSQACFWQRQHRPGTWQICISSTPPRYTSLRNTLGLGGGQPAPRRPLFTHLVSQTSVCTLKACRWHYRPVGRRESRRKFKVGQPASFQFFGGWEGAPKGLEQKTSTGLPFNARAPGWDETRALCIVQFWEPLGQHSSTWAFSRVRYKNLKVH